MIDKKKPVGKEIPFIDDKVMVIKQSKIALKISLTKPPSRSGEIKPRIDRERVSKGWTYSAKEKVQDACVSIEMECRSRKTKSGRIHKGYFTTLTLKPEHRQKSDQDVQKLFKYFLERWRKLAYADKNKKRIEKGKRKLTTLKYVWILERQEDGTLHMHIVHNNRIPKTLFKWGQQEIGRIRVELINGSAKRYMTKYIVKDNAEISGRRYSISENIMRRIKYEEVTRYYFNEWGEYYEAIILDLFYKHGSSHQYGRTIKNYQYEWNYRKVQEYLENIQHLIVRTSDLVYQGNLFADYDVDSLKKPSTYDEYELNLYFDLDGLYSVPHYKTDIERGMMQVLKFEQIESYIREQVLVNVGQLKERGDK